MPALSFAAIKARLTKGPHYQNLDMGMRIAEVQDVGMQLKFRRTGAYRPGWISRPAGWWRPPSVAQGTEHFRRPSCRRHRSAGGSSRTTLNQRWRKCGGQHTLHLDAWLAPVEAQSRRRSALALASIAAGTWRVGYTCGLPDIVQRPVRKPAGVLQCLSSPALACCCGGKGTRFPPFFPRAMTFVISGLAL